MNLPKISSAFGSLFLLLWVSSPLSAVSPPPPPVDLLLPPSDAVSLLTFKSKADLDNKLLYALHERFDYCEWQGVKCAQGRVVRFSLQGYGLRGTFSPDSLTRLEQLRVLSLRNNSLFGPIPNLSRLVNLKSLLLGRNFFSGSFPPSVLSLYKLRLLDLAFNNLTGPIPVEINRVDRLNCLNLEFNRFNGSLPPLNQSDLSIFNVSGNNFTGPIPNTSTLTQFQASAFSLNPYLCGEIIDKPCNSPSPFFKSSSSNNTSPTTATGSSNSSNSQSVIPSPSPRKHQRTALILGFSFGSLTLVSSLFLCLFATMRNHRMKAGLEKTIAEGETVRSNQLFDPETITVRLDSQSNELTEKCEKKRSTGAEKLTREKSGELVFCVGEEKLYALEHLMRASAEMLGRGIIGATYKAKLDNRMTLTVKRIDGGKFCAVDGDTFERHMEMVGALRHPNLVPVRAYFQAKGERLIIYDYQPNGSVFNLIHGSRSARAKPLHWTSCLKIAEDVAQGLAYIHQASNFIHGNLKSSNVLLGADFEACVTDYCIATLADTSSDNDPDSVRYRAPELRKSSSQATAKSDVYAFGVLLLEILSGKPPSLHPFLAPPDMPDWVRAMRGEDFSDTDRLGMLVEVASVCSLTSPEQRPSMWHVLKMIQKIKSSLMTENLFDQSTRFP